HSVQSLLARSNSGPARRQQLLLAKIALCGALSGLIALTSAGAQQTHASQGAPEGSLISRQAIALNPATGKVYAVDTSRGTVSIIDGAAHSVSTVKVGAGPVAIAVNPVTNRVYVANHEGGTVSVLDGRSNLLLATINVGSIPYALAANPETNKIYVSNVFSNVLTILDGKTNAVTRMNAGSFDAMLIDPKVNSVYLLSYESSSLTLLNGISDAMSRIPLGEMHLWGFALDEPAKTLYVTRVGHDDVVAIDENTHSWKAIATGRFPCAVAVNHRTNTVYVLNYVDESVTVIDVSKGHAVATIHVGRHPQAIAVDEKTNLIFVANRLDSTVSVIDGSKNAVIANLKTGKNPYAFAVNSAAGRLYVANAGEPSFTEINIGKLLNQAPRNSGLQGQ
ncbi:MAG: YncE family protein, partial [Silvibacterium sp.]